MSYIFLVSLNKLGHVLSRHGFDILDTRKEFVASGRKIRMEYVPGDDASGLSDSIVVTGEVHLMPLVSDLMTLCLWSEQPHILLLCASYLVGLDTLYSINDASVQSVLCMELDSIETCLRAVSK